MAIQSMVGREVHARRHVVQSWDWHRAHQKDTFAASCVFHPIDGSSFMTRQLFVENSFAIQQELAIKISLESVSLSFFFLVLSNTGSAERWVGSQPTVRTNESF